MYSTIRNLLFKFDAEKTHHLAEFFLSKIASQPLIQDLMIKKFSYQNPVLENEVNGIKFFNPIGMAAGFDKNASMIEGLSLLGFGYLELGTLTKKAQIGNPKPRLWRHVEEKSLQNAMGFNNNGAPMAARNLASRYPFCLPLGINLGKNKDIPQEEALQSYKEVLSQMLNFGDYYVFNLSSPNTPNLRDLQNVSFVDELFCMARELTYKPIFLKISPDMPVDAMLEVCQMAVDKGASGIIATNTTIDYSIVRFPKESGGISGAALREKSAEVLKILAQSFFKKTTLISVGGIDSAAEAYRRIRLGASLIQIFSAMVFEGPSVVSRMNANLASLLARDGFDNISQAIGVDL